MTQVGQAFSAIEKISLDSSGFKWMRVLASNCRVDPRNRSPGKLEANSIDDHACHCDYPWHLFKSRPFKTPRLANQTEEPWHTKALGVRKDLVARLPTFERMIWKRFWRSILHKR